MSRQSIVATGLVSILVAGCGIMHRASKPAEPEVPRWVASWGTAQMVPDGPNELPAAQWRDASLRQIVHVSLGGSTLRVRLSNVFGTAPLVIDGASVALAAKPGRAEVDAGSLRQLRFGGSPAVTIPAGADYVSDPVALTHAAGADLAVSMHFGAEPARQTGHPGSRTTSFIAHGNQVLAAAWPQADKVTHWYQLTGIEVLGAPAAHAVVVIGDSITDGYGVPPDMSLRWTDAFAVRLRGLGMQDVAVVNAGIGGGRMLQDGLGPNLASRFERDVLARPGVSHAIVMIGVNDFGVQHRNKEDTPAARARLLEELQQANLQIVARAHAQGVCVLGATITPYARSDYYKPSPDNEADRQAYNAWIRNSGAFDGVVDFDAALRDPARQAYLRSDYDNDGLHPSVPGYAAMANAVPVEPLKSCRHARH